MRRGLVVRSLPITSICVAAILAGGFRGAGAAPQDKPARTQIPDFHVGVKVEMVSVFATIQDRKGKIVTGLNQDDFVVYDNNTPQPISQFSREDMPLSIVILLDTSSSMAGKKLDNAKKSLEQFLRHLDKGDEAMLITFSSRPVLVQDFSANLDRIKRSIRRLDGNGSTALYDAILMGLKESGRAHNRRHVLLLLSDGINTYGSAELRGTISKLRHSAAELFAIGLETDLPEELQYRPITQSVLDQLTGSAGGEAFIVAQAKDLARVCNQISDRMHSQYTFAYYPPKARDGSWRSVRIETKIPGLTVIPSKIGYYPAADAAR